MLANIIIVVFILAMAYWWALQGFFSAFLHLMLVIICGSLAFAFWEPLVHAFGMSTKPEYAWGLYLLGPFILSLMILRGVTDRLVKKNVQFQDLVNKILGGVCGIVSGVLTAGIVVIGLGFLPLPSSLGGYEPYVVSATGDVIPEGTDLWVPVDRVAGGFFGTMAYNGFYHPTPLPEYQPNLAEAANLYRLRYDPHSAVVAVLGSVQATRAAAATAPVEQLNAGVSELLTQASEGQASLPGRQLVVIDTAWQQQPGTYDTDGGLRIPPPQIRLITRKDGPGGGTSEVHAPVAFSQDVGNARAFTPITGLDVAFGNRQSESFAWAFIVPADETARFLRVRNLRLTLPEIARDGDAVANLLGVPVDPAAGGDEAGTEATGPSGVGGREGIMAGNVADQIELTANLPRQISANAAHGLRHTEGAITEGSATASKPPGSLSRNTRIDRVHIPTHQGAVRLRILPDRARSLLGGARVAAASLQGVWLVDERGDRYQPIAYVWSKTGSGEQEIRVDRNQPITSARQLPIQQLGSDDELFLYFALPKGSQVVSYHIGETTQQAIDPPLQVN